MAAAAHITEMVAEVVEAMAAAMVETTIIKDRPNGGRKRETERDRETNMVGNKAKL